MDETKAEERTAPEPLREVRHGPLPGSVPSGPPFHVLIGSAVEPDARVPVHPLLNHTASLVTRKGGGAFVVPVPVA